MRFILMLLSQGTTRNIEIREDSDGSFNYLSSDSGQTAIVELEKWMVYYNCRGGCMFALFFMRVRA